MASSLTSGLNLPPGFVLPSLDGLDLSRHDSVEPTIKRVGVAFITIVSLILAIRIYVRARIVRKVGADDRRLICNLSWTAADNFKS